MLEWEVVVVKAGDAVASTDPGGPPGPPDAAWLILQRLDDLRRAQEEVRVDMRSLEERVTARVDGLDTRVGAVETELVAVGARLDRVDSRLDGVDSRLDGVDSRLDGVNARLDRVDSRLDGVDAKLGAIDIKLDGLANHMAVSDARLTGSDARMDAMDRSLHAIDAKIASTAEAAESRISGLERRMEAGFVALDAKVESVRTWSTGVLLLAVLGLIAKLVIPGV